ncbi:hypothetical protein Emtol_2739 [Emticicia oligotrophica DSM 17448]|uniref:DinB family protein n=1 Tax=Emticicia oligotrophica (strain DSM 17448 / CIP 109782 / MTCC 6937 / GPTSA100-15) TaxID=929562 RepID=A0ABN4ANH7_EMTOG|nr:MULTISPECIES: DinB family protein [Emticicia]AFK03875.1 hypothetical protein Emtol_2739 [Emticicia oligotrophica DSM 17448]
MMKNLMLDMLLQSQISNGVTLKKVSNENAQMKLNSASNSVGFIYRHIAETLNMFTFFFGLQPEVANTTMGQLDNGQGSNTDESSMLINKGFEKLNKLIEEKPEQFWLEEIETPFFGKVSRFRIFSHILYHNSHHSGQIAAILSKGK